MKTEIKFGLIAGIGVILWVMAEYFLGFHTTRFEIGRYSGYFSSLIPIAALYVALKTRRDKEQAGFLTIKQGVQSGFVISLIASVIITLFFLIYNNYINPEWIKLAMAWEKQQMLQHGASQAEIAAKMKQLEAMNSPMAQVLWGLVGTTGMGTLFSLVIAIVLKRKKEEP